MYCSNYCGIDPKRHNSVTSVPRVVPSTMQLLVGHWHLDAVLMDTSLTTGNIQEYLPDIPFSSSS